MGAAKASELLLFNKKISAAEAFNRNLVTEVIPDSSFQKETQTKIEALAKLQKEVSELLQPFPFDRHFLMPMQLKAYKNIVAKREISNLATICSTLFNIYIYTFIYRAYTYVYPWY